MPFAPTEAIRVRALLPSPEADTAIKLLCRIATLKPSAVGAKMVSVLWTTRTEVDAEGKPAPELRATEHSLDRDVGGRGCRGPTMHGLCALVRDADAASAAAPGGGAATTLTASDNILITLAAACQGPAWESTAEFVDERGAALMELCAHVGEHCRDRAGRRHLGGEDVGHRRAVERLASGRQADGAARLGVERDRRVLSS